MVQGKKVEKPRPLGDRVYAKHRKMIAAIAKKKSVSKAEGLRFAIEDTHARICTAA